ncbi:MAG: flavodoxin family protein [Deltaproteobacteria bacterium]|nr:flavodoxin family protein [Candidatus Anaeroferrophillus wilburensis]MBN2889949.1 flavodoxin family protein [Deltaproteobacteria bacterium]
MDTAKKTILGLIASPRKLGNCEILTKEICRNLPDGYQLKLIRLPAKNIKTCRACYACLDNGECPLDDDFQAIMSQMAAADGIILASPCYFMGQNGILKVFLDRCLQMYPHLTSLRDKPVITLVTAGIKGEAGYTEAALQSFSLIFGLKIQASAVFYGALPGESLWQNPAQQERIKQLAGRFFSPEPRPFEAWCCPLCGSDSVQLLGGNRVQCQVCRNFGTLALQDDRVVLDIVLKPENIFFTVDQANHHRQWLQGMKQRFLQVRRQLAEFQQNYADDGEWL